jgi:hypothetical protein
MVGRLNALPLFSGVSWGSDQRRYSGRACRGLRSSVGVWSPQGAGIPLSPEGDSPLAANLWKSSFGTAILAAAAPS